MEEKVNLERVQMQQINVFFVFDRVLKDPDAFILKKIARDYKDKFRDFINIDLINTISLEMLTALMINRKVKNPLEAMAIKEFDYEENYKFLYKQFKEMYAESVPLFGWQIVQRFIVSFAVGNIYIWNPEDDIRQRYEIASQLKSPKIKYITGDYDSAIEKARPTLIYDWDADRIHDRVNNLQNAMIALTNYEFNFDQKTRLVLKHHLTIYPNVSTIVAYHIPRTAKYKG